MILLQIMRERVVCELCQDDITPNHEGKGGVRAMPG
jgi:hypothetical protein